MVKISLGSSPCWLLNNSYSVAAAIFHLKESKMSVFKYQELLKDTGEMKMMDYKQVEDVKIVWRVII